MLWVKHDASRSIALEDTPTPRRVGSQRASTRLRRSRDHCGLDGDLKAKGDRGAAVLRPDQAIDEAAWGGRNGILKEKGWRTTTGSE